jgi:hypothetical protein
MKQHSRKFGKATVTLTATNTGISVCVAGDYLTNWGSLYEHAFDRFRAFKAGTYRSQGDGIDVQVIGMESPISPTIKAWIEGKILSGKLPA